jgi:serine/threonine protein kinase/beta-lactam-binding protein with PASTA domain
VSENQRILAERYEVGSLIGRGGMADVYDGLDTRLGRKVAIKLLKSDLANDPTFEARFRQEAQASARMAHPTIVRVYDAGEEISTDANGNERKTPYIVMEYVRGTLLRDLLHERKLGIPEAIGYAEGVLTALEFSHRAGVIHRDIKAANIMITDTGLVKVMDFGIARAVSESSATQAHTNGIVGTAQYFSPEQARGEAVDHRTDLYSTGVLLYEMLAGRPPFKGETAVSVAYQHVSEAVTPPSEHNPLISRELDEVVLRALAKDRNDRFQTAEEFRDHLLAASIEPPVISAPVEEPVAEPTIEPFVEELDGLEAIEHQLTPEAAAALSDLDQFEAIISGALGDSAGDLVGDAELDANELSSEVVDAGEAQLDREDAASALEVEPTAPVMPATPSWNAPVAPTEVIGSFEEATQAIHTPPKQEEQQSASDSNPFAALGLGNQDSESGATQVVTERKPMKNAGLVWGFGSGAVVFVIGMLVWLLTSISLPNVIPTGDTIKVSDVSNMPYQSARDTLVAQKLLVHEAFEVSDTVPVDSVIRTDPIAGTAVGVNTLITVYVSSGKTQFAMPDLSGMNEKMAKDALDQAKLTLGTIVQAHSSTVPQGQVIESDPIAGTMIAAGTTVNLTISDGLVDVPNVRNYSISDAKSALNDSGLTVEIGTKDTCATAPQGTTVVDQSILPGTTQAGGTITLYVTCAP